MLDLTSLANVLNAIREWFQSARTIRRDQEQTDEEVLTALYTALNETKIYIGSLGCFSAIRPRLDPFVGSGAVTLDPPYQAAAQERDREAEARISRLWTAASLKLRRFDHDLADRCLMKGDYWADPEQWTDEQIRVARIQINVVFREARRLL